MNRMFRRMLEEAARIRAVSRSTGSTIEHSGQMFATLKYAMERGLFSGNVHDGTANEENLAQAAEMAAFILEVVHGAEEVGDVLTRSRADQCALCERASQKAHASIAAFERTQGRN